MTEEQTGSQPKKSNETLVLIIASLAAPLFFAGVFFALGMGSKSSSTAELGSSPQPTASPSANAAALRSLETKALRIGILGSKEKYQPLVDHLRAQFGEQVQISLDGNEEISYQDAKANISTKAWDVVFTLSPMLSISARDNGYSFAARMFPKFDPYYESALYVRKDSPIQSIEDLKPTTTIALGDFNSASSFYMPIYDLFGKTLRVNMGHRGSEIQKMVKEGQADVGSGAFESIKGKSEFRVIQVSRKIPGSGVYLSSSLSATDRAAVQEVLLSAPQAVQDAANYGKGEEVDYTSFIEISRKVEEFLTCATFSSSDPIPLFCNKSATAPASPLVASGQSITGRINGFSYPTADTLILTLSGKDGQAYRIVLPRKLLNTIPDAPPPPGLNGKTVQVTGTTSGSENGILEVRITDSEQLKIVQSQSW
jgi:ABC-type phosphate/phosphonate transport system substrate-binding protein